MATSASSHSFSSSRLLHRHDSCSPKPSRVLLSFSPGPSAEAHRSSFRIASSRTSDCGRDLRLHPLRALAATHESITEASEQAQKKKYYFLVANAMFMLDEEEHFQELMNERIRNFGERNRKQDFWIVIEPKFLDKFPVLTKRLKRPAVSLVSTDYLWITFMKLRLDRVLRGEIEANTLTEALKSNPVDLNFEKPEKWTAPYTKYAGPWWTRFLPPQEE